jgi:hypothetical protein
MNRVETSRGSMTIIEDGEVVGTASESELFPGAIAVSGGGAEGHPSPAQARRMLARDYGVTKAQFDEAFGHLSGAAPSRSPEAAQISASSRKSFIIHVKRSPGGIVVHPRESREEFVWVMDEVINPDTGKPGIFVRASPSGKAEAFMTATTAAARWKDWGGDPNTFGQAFGHLLQREKQSRASKARSRKTSRPT